MLSWLKTQLESGAKNKMISVDKQIRFILDNHLSEDFDLESELGFLVVQVQKEIIININNIVGMQLHKSSK